MSRVLPIAVRFSIPVAQDASRPADPLQLLSSSRCCNHASTGCVRQLNEQCTKATVRVITRRPSQESSTCSPTAETVPATPTPGRYGG